MPGPKKVIDKLKSKLSGNKAKEEKTQSTWYDTDSEHIYDDVSTQEEVGGVGLGNPPPKPPRTFEHKFDPSYEKVNFTAKANSSGVSEELMQQQKQLVDELKQQFSANNVKVKKSQSNTDSEHIYDDVPNEEEHTYGNVGDNRNTFHTDIKISDPSKQHYGNMFYTRKDPEGKLIEPNTVEKFKQEYNKVVVDGDMSGFIPQGDPIMEEDKYFTTKDGQLFYLNKDGEIEPIYGRNDLPLFLSDDGKLYEVEEHPSVTYSTVSVNTSKVRSKIEGSTNSNTTHENIAPKPNIKKTAEISAGGSSIEAAEQSTVAKFRQHFDNLSKSNEENIVSDDHIQYQASKSPGFNQTDGSVQVKPTPAPRPSKKKATELSAEQAAKQEELINKLRKEYDGYGNNPNSLREKDIDLKSSDLEDQVSERYAAEENNPYDRNEHRTNIIDIDSDNFLPDGTTEEELFEYENPKDADLARDFNVLETFSDA